MLVISPYPSIIAILIAYLIAVLLSKFDKNNNYQINHAFPSIDGLRGYLAFAVFLHHGVIWYYYLRTGKWAIPPSNLYANFGRDGVSLFFMITGLLFGRKILDGREREIDWFRLYIGRFFRLFPLYLMAVSILFFIVAFMSKFNLNEPLYTITIKVLRWIMFAALGNSANINEIKDTGLIFAGVTWTLTYEWFFYFSLPVIGIFFGAKSRWYYFLCSMLAVATCFWWKPEIYYILTFILGIFASYLSKMKNIQKFARAKISSILAIGSLLGIITLNNSAKALIGLPFLFIFFIIVASGNDLFGLLRQKASILLGEISYGIYLLHGILICSSCYCGLRLLKNYQCLNIGRY